AVLVLDGFALSGKLLAIGCRYRRVERSLVGGIGLGEHVAHLVGVAAIVLDDVISHSGHEASPCRADNRQGRHMVACRDRAAYILASPGVQAWQKTQHSASRSSSTSSSSAPGRPG